MEVLDPRKLNLVMWEPMGCGDRCEEIKATVQKHTQELRYSKDELNRMNQAIQELTPCELEQAKDHPLSEQKAAAAGSATLKVAWLEAALQRAKKLTVQQLREYQELMFIKLSLDLKIAAYQKLLKGKESCPLASGFLCRLEGEECPRWQIRVLRLLTRSRRLQELQNQQRWNLSWLSSARQGGLVSDLKTP
ncbi:keratin, type II cuticular Hb1-like [Suncus etruscus]|uniref:keratin, type II cuticular Hb1-like n=1 Tax=Suncus etruscus TaxID=109475 RepID=UPI00210F70C9|nr:keratin, type II cuticular Hb1-like [Suncus etruscus]